MTETTLLEPSEPIDDSEDTAEVATFPKRLEEDDAETLLTATDNEVAQTSVVEILYYPYQIFDFRIQVEALFNSFDQAFSCGVDLRRERALLIDESLEPTVKSIPTDQALPIKHKDVTETARTYLTKVVHRRLTISRSVTLTRQDSYRRYRPFYHTWCQTTDGHHLHYIVDGVTGDFHRIYNID